MTARLKAQIAALLPPVPARKRPTARELLHALIECTDIESFDQNGDARMTLTVPPRLLDELAEWDGDEREPDEDVEAA